MYIFPRASRIRSGSRAGMLHFQACASRSKNNFHSVLPSDSMLVGCFALWLWAPEPNEKCGKKSRGEEKWMSCWSCSNAVILHLHQAVRSSATMDYGSSWLTHASPTWITLTDTGRMQLSPMSPFCSTSNTNWPVGLTHFGSAADWWRCILRKHIISILWKDVVSCVIIPVCFAPVRDQRFLFCVRRQFSAAWSRPLEMGIWMLWCIW